MNYLSHGYCFLWNTDLIALHAISDTLIFLAYFAIPIELVRLYRHRPRLLDFLWMKFLLALCFAVFIFACGLTHLMEVINIWKPDYWLSGTIKAVTAVSSIATYFLLHKTVPALVKLPHDIETLVEKDRHLQQLVSQLSNKFDNVGT